MLLLLMMMIMFRHCSCRLSSGAVAWVGRMRRSVWSGS